MKRIFVVGTCDTKGAELDYLRQLIRAAGGDAMLVDVGTGTPGIAADVSATVVAGCHPQGVQAVLGGVAGVAVLFKTVGGRFRRKGKTEEGDQITDSAEADEPLAPPVPGD